MCATLALLLAACSPAAEQNPPSPTIHAHAYGQWTVVEEATCAEEGLQRRTCPCGDTEEQTIPMSMHQYDDTGECALCGSIDPDSYGNHVAVQEWDNTLPFACSIMNGSEEQTIRGTYYLPGDCSDLDDVKGRHIFFVCHGMHSDSSKDSIKMIAVRLASNGILDITFDFRGATKTSMSDGTNLDLSLRTEMDDINSCIDYVKSQAWAAESDISLFGISQGGCVSLLTAAERVEMDDITCVATWFPALCVQADAVRFLEENNMTLDDLPDPLPAQGYGMASGAAKKIYADVIDWDIIEMISAYDNPVFLSHGDADGLVPITWAEQAEEKFNAVGEKNCVFDVVEGGDYGYNGENKLKELDRSWAYIRDLLEIESNNRPVEEGTPTPPFQFGG